MGVVPVSEALRRLAEDPRFWIGDGPPPADQRELRVPFPVAGGFGLVLDLDLATAAPESPWPAALRWWELDLCARVIALEDPTLPHPGLVVALLAPFAPATADDDPAEIAAVCEAAYRSLRRDVPEPIEPEQDPLPLFAGPQWWPRESPLVLDEAAVAALTTPASERLEVRGGSRFPHQGLAALVRAAAERLAREPRADCYTDALPLARHIASTGDLRPVRDLLGALTEAGCDHPTVLDALSEPLVALEACWMVETLAGAAPGTLLRRHL
jgi:hypothetical protein